MVDAFTFPQKRPRKCAGHVRGLDGAPQGKGAQLSGLRTMVTDLVVAESRHEAIEQQFFWPLVRERLEDGNPREPGISRCAGRLHRSGPQAHRVRTERCLAAHGRRTERIRTSGSGRDPGPRQAEGSHAPASGHAVRTGRAEDDGCGRRRTRQTARCGDRAERSARSSDFLSARVWRDQRGASARIASAGSPEVTSAITGVVTPDSA